MRTYVSILVISLLLICVAGCNDKAAKDTDMNQAEPVASPEKTPIVIPEVPEFVAPEIPAPPKAAKYNPQEVAVTVNGEDITEGDIMKMLEPQLKKMAERAPANVLQQYKAQLRARVLENIILDKLMAVKIKESDMAVTEDEITERLDQMVATQGITMDDVKQMAEAAGQSLDTIKDNIKKGIAYQKMMEVRYADELNVSPEDVQNYYNENKKNFEVPEQVQASHILIKFNPTDSNEVKAEALKKTQGLLEKIKNGADFATVAKENSTCPSSEKGGDLGLFGRGQMVPAFEETAFAMQTGEVSDVVKTRFGYHIIKVTDKTEASAKSLDEVKEDISAMLKQQKQKDVAIKYIEEIKSEATIVYPAGKEPKPAAPSMMTRPQ